MHDKIKREPNVGEKWLTLFEKSNATESPNYLSSIDYFYQMAEESTHAKVVSFGITAQRREMFSVIVAANKEFTAKKAKKSGKTVVLIQNCIHPGEIDGKDATMLLVRKILITKELSEYLDEFIFVIVPVVNPDGHERLSKFNRPNQNGPKEMGWRTTANNLNMNRDYMKAESPEMKALIRLYAEWLPDFVIDNHTTNGADFQYQLTYGLDYMENMDEGLGRWGREKFLPQVISNLENKGYLVNPYVDPNAGEIKNGISYQPSQPRLSNGYTALHNRLCLLVEAHSLKPFETRVYATLDFNIEALNFILRNSRDLKRLNQHADSNTIQKFLFKREPLPLNFVQKPDFEMVNFKGFRTYQEESWVLGGPVLRYTNEEVDFEVPFYNQCEPVDFVTVPDIYLIPVEFAHVVRLLKLHGIRVDQLPHDAWFYVEKYRFRKEEFTIRPYEACHTVKFECDMFRDHVMLPKDTYRVPVNQRALKLIVNLLEPKAPDSLAAWGFFNAFFERKEYVEPFIFEPYAQEMIEKEPSLKDDFEAFLEKNPKYKTNPAARLDFFYRRSPFFDKGEKVYPILRVTFRKSTPAIGE